MEIAAVVHIFGIRIHNGIVAGSVHLFFQHPAGLGKGVVNGAQDLRRAAQGIIGLHLLLKIRLLVLAAKEFNLAFGETPGRC